MISEIVEVLAKIAHGIKSNYSLEQVECIIDKSDMINKSMIAAAYSWIYEKMYRNLHVEKELPGKKLKNFRILLPDEVLIIGLQNYNYLLHYNNSGLLNAGEMNLIVEQLKLHAERTVSKNHLDILILSLFLDMDNYLQPGSRNLLYSSDTIN